ncbi:NADPH:quinone reductase [Mucilaginibacter sp. OK268]|uniref:zinc-dependent alcohol dehydrogenase family protein n=1 Tax=Mucilaginibacter sp. OK268 TaxID=1881048 RepID=UPI00088F47DD|nr:NAD(P)-dependent alcohol dehydrogenase [Mucilaginibacter sp. OK268]SDP20634.1 NADPH:quinone reductase [Mucilaginibacter sp. OK268]
MSDINKTMKAWQLHAFGLDNLTLDTIAKSEPKAHEILIKVGAVSLNFRDKAIVDGIYEPEMIPKPLIPVSDAAGTVVAVGADVTKFKVGDRVISHLYSHWIEGAPAPDEPAHCLGAPYPGGLAEYMILEAESAVLAPSTITDEEASTLPIAALTAWFSLVTYGNLKAGETVVIQGTGGVSIFGLQIAHALGARVIVTTSSDAKGQKARELGADEIINYVTTPDWAKKVQHLTNGKGADQLLEVVGGEGLNDSVEATKVTGQIAVIGFLAGQTTNLDLMRVIFKQTKIQGIAVGHLTAFEEMNKAFDAYNIKPVIEKVYPFEQAVEAYQHLAKGAFGKIVIKMS